jgi:fido (protein-threonine AMPylation protein)
MFELQAVIDRYKMVGQAWVNAHTCHGVYNKIFNKPGKWRSGFVTINGIQTGAILANIQYEMNRLETHANPMRTVEQVKEWYTAFMRIHPYEDGNGRVGGTILAAASFYVSKYMFVIVDRQWPDESIRSREALP